MVDSGCPRSRSTTQGGKAAKSVMKPIGQTEYVTSIGPFSQGEKGGGGWTKGNPKPSCRL